MNQGTVPFIDYHISGLLIFFIVLMVGACAADEPEHVLSKEDQPEQPDNAIQVREWYPTPKIQQGPYYVFPADPGQGMQQQQITAVPSAQQGQDYASGYQSWQPYPVQQGTPQYPATGGWAGYGGQAPQQQPVVQPQRYQSVPQYQQSSQPGQPYQSAPQYQPYPVQPQYQQYQPQYPPAQRPWGVPGNTQSGGDAARQSMDTWQMPNQNPGWNPPVYNGYSGPNPGQYGTTQNNAAPGFFW
jgi:hypothetical protein